ncbi:MAG: hypothetical protein EOM69_11545, partial [Clostridia bacterium]|nr:hypothetical protein [Clostridia bacterium]
GYAIRAEAHEAMPLTDALLRVSGGSYARLDTVLQGSAVTGVTAEALVTAAQGQVSDASGATVTPLGNLGVVLQNEKGDCAYGSLTDDAGSFTLLADASVQTGTLTVALPENAMLSETQQTGWATLDAMALPRQDLNLSFVLLSGLKGSVTNDEGAPLPGVTVSLLQNGVAAQSSVTDAQGQYHVTGLQGGTYDVALILPDPWTAAVIAPTGTMQQARNTYTMPALSLGDGQTQQLDWTLTLLSTLRGMVTQGDAPVSGITATLTGESGAILTAQTDAQGVYIFDELASGTYQLTLQLPENTVAVSANGEGMQAMVTYTATRVLSAGETVEDAFQLEATATIKGPAGPLGAGQSIAAASVDTQHSVTTAEDGSFLFEGLISGDYTIYAPLPEGQTLLEGSQWRVSERGDMIWITINVAPGDVLTLPEVQFVA